MGNRVELDEMGKRILDTSRTELYLSMRFLGPALHSLGFIMDLSTTSVGTDAAYIRFNPNYLFSLYVDRPHLLNRTYLHMLLHCVFRHMFTAREKADRELWDLACDIRVGSILDSMEYGAVAELTSEYRQRVYDRLLEDLQVLTAERIYQYFLERKRNYLEELQLRAAFALCDHSFWERMEEEDPEEDEPGKRDPEKEDPENEAPWPEEREEEPQAKDREEEDPEERDRKQSDPAAEKPGDEDPGEKPDGDPVKKEKPDPGQREGKQQGGRKKAGDPQKEQKDRRQGQKPPDGRRSPDRRDDSPPGNDWENAKRLRRLKKRRDLESGWEETAKRMEADIAVSGKEASRERGSLDRILQISNRRRTDYREFLRRFAILREVTTIDPDSFDYGFYNYGLEVYGNMPLIEENEYREMNRIRTLVIAIDTSASCQDVLVQRFLNETAAVLRNIGQFFYRSEVHIIECDEHVQAEIVVHDPQELEKYADAFHVKGGFGTDFRPVFTYVEEKRKAGELQNLEGLMYFTDGMGIYPEKPTDYDTAFVFFNDEELDDTKVPDWAVRLYLDPHRDAPVRQRPGQPGLDSRRDMW